MTDLPPPPPVDYTSRDFESIRDDLIGLIPTFMPEWTSRSASDFGITLLELFAYVGDGLNYNADRAANEAFLDTATQRSSLIRLARLLGYTPTSTLAASTTLTFTNSTGSSIVVPAGSKVATALSNVNDTPVQFETDSDVTVPASSTATVTAHEGTTISNEQIGVSDGTAQQTFPLFNPEVISGSVTVSVNDGVSTTVWTYVPHLITAGPFDRVFTLVLDENDVSSVVFGDGANGQVPVTNSTLTATYRIGGGAAGNVAANTLTKIVSSLPAGLTVTNASGATGGADAESNESIRTNASKAFSTSLRAVTLDDYANVAVAVDGVGKASAASSNPNSVTVYIIAQGGGAPSTALTSSVTQALNTAKPDPVSVTVLGASGVPINVTLTAHLASNYSQARVGADITTALNALFSFDNVILGDTVTVGDVQRTLSQIIGVVWTDITVFDRDAGSGLNSAITLAINELPVVGTLSVSLSGGI